jgi:hypothetical protein
VVHPLVDADPVAAAVGFLAAHATVIAEFGAGVRVNARNEPPYPRVRIQDPPGGDDRDLRWLVSTVVQVETLGDLDNSTSKAALRRLHYVALTSLAELADRVPTAGQLTVSHVETVGGAGWSPDPVTRQPRYVSTVRLHFHP